MIKEYYHDIDMNANQLFNSRLHNISTAARIILGNSLSTSDKGYMVYDTDLSSPYFWDGTQWLAAGGSGPTPNLQDVVNVANTITNFGGLGNASIQSTNFTNGRTLYLNDNAYPTIRLVDNANASNYLQIDIDTLNIDGVSYNWSSIVNPAFTSLTTTGSSGSSTLLSGVLNIPTYTLSGLGGEPIISTGTSSQYWRGDKTWQTFPTIPTVGTWGALNYPTWVSGTPFVKMTAAGTFSLDSTSYQPLLTNPITGTGTINYIPKWSSSSALTDSQIFDNGTNVGIGTITPGYKLDVNGEINTNVGIRLGTNGAQTGIYGGANIFDFWAGNNKIATWGLAPLGGTYYDYFAGPVYNTGDSGVITAFKIRSSLTSNSANNAGLTQLDISPIYTQQTFGTGTLRGVYYHPQLNSLNGSTHIAWENTSGDIIHGNLATGGADEMVTVDTNGKLKKQTIPSGSTSPLTTKGDIYTYSTTDARLPVGLDTQILIADSTTSTGLKWGSNTAPTPLGYYAQYQDLQTQTVLVINTGYPIKFRTLDISNGVTVVSDSRITFANTGVYNLQFSVQFENSDTQEHDVTIWLRKNGVDFPGSAGFVAVVAKHGGINGHMITSWNYLLDVVGGEYYELIWSATSTQVTMPFIAAGSPPPSTASAIFTVTQQAGIMAGTGITRGVYSVSTNTAALAGANVDYVYLVSGTTTITLPTAVGNTNQYTIKRVNTGVVSIATTSSQTIDGSASPITINVQYVSITVVSDGANWNII